MFLIKSAFVGKKALYSDAEFASFKIACQEILICSVMHNKRMHCWNCGIK